MGIRESLGTEYNYFMLPKPVRGKYSVISSRASDTFYTVNFSAYGLDGDIVSAKSIGTLSQGSKNEFNILYSPDSTSTISEIVTFNTMLDDIKNLRTQHHMSTVSALTLYAIVKEAKRFYNINRPVLAKNTLSIAKYLISTYSRGSIDQTAKTILLNDIILLDQNL